MLKRQTLKRGDLITLGYGHTAKMGIVIETHDEYREWPAATIYMFDEDRRIRCNQNLYSLEKLT